MRSGAARDAFCSSTDVDPTAIDPQLVSDVLRVSGTVASAAPVRATLVELCALVRAIDAYESGRIGVEELRAGLALHSGRTDGFAQFGDVRVVLRTLTEVLEHGRVGATPAAVDAQVAYVHADLRAWLVERLTGGREAAAQTGAADCSSRRPDAMEPHRVASRDEVARLDALVEELLHPTRSAPFGGTAGAVWLRGWTAAPVIGEFVGEDPAELDRLADVLAAAGIDAVQQVRLARGAAWNVTAERRVVALDRARASWTVPAARRALGLLGRERGYRTLITCGDERFVLLEREDHHVVLGERSFVAGVCGVGVGEAIAAFRLAVEELDDGELGPPQHLLDAAALWGRLRRRGLHDAG